MRITIDGEPLRFMCSSIDIAMWILVQDNDEEWDHNRTPYGFLLTYVDDFMVVGPPKVRSAIEEEISKLWETKVTGSVDQFDTTNFEASVTFLSTTIRSHPTLGGFTMSQEDFISDTLKVWDMQDCRPLLTPGEPTAIELPEEGTPEQLDPGDILRAQKMAGALIWLSTRTRPDIAYAQSRISSMATKAPQRAVIEGLRLLRYLQGTKSLTLRFKPCENHEDMIAFTDANFSVGRSQSGTVIKLGENTVAWRSAKQCKSVLNTAESEVYACACTANIADYIKELRESVCLPTPNVEVRCDNKACIVLATGEGSWKTKGAANKVYYLRELVEFELVKVNYIPTNLQAADSLTKFLKSGAEQLTHRELLGLMDECAGKGSVQACSVPDRAQVCSVRVSEQNPKPLVKSCGNLASVAISALSRHNASTIRQAPPDSLEVAVGAMVKVVKGGRRNDWKFSTFQDVITRDVNAVSNKEYFESLDAVDVLTIACGTDPCPAEKLDDKTFKNYGVYCGGTRFVQPLLDDMINVPMVEPNGRKCGRQHVCRWAYIPVNEDRVSDYSERKEQNYRQHGYAM